MVEVNVLKRLFKKTIAFIIIILTFYSCKKEELYNDNLHVSAMRTFLPMLDKFCFLVDIS